MKRNTRLWIWAVVVIILSLLWWWKCVDHTILDDSSYEIQDASSSNIPGADFTLWHS